ncbi:MAG: SDR family NAD(P)-dependent oxidoreductase [Solirubrobacteraceae bacterium]|jgi:decaprenylphospho-beta-D-erythro-pentofuranosid-2-ulose 2-reductase
MNGTAQQRVLLVGGSSEIGLAILSRLAADSPVLPYLLGRDRGALEAAAAALRRAGTATAELDTIDADDIDAHGEVIARAFARLGGFELVVLAIGLLGAQAGLDADRADVVEVMRVNFVGCGSLLWHCLRHLRAQELDCPGRGARPSRRRSGATMVVLSSVAAERARAGNPIYGAAKAGLDSLTQGLADACAASGPRVLVVRPGFVRGRMTAGLPVAPFATTPEAVADATVRALPGRARTIWVPGQLRFVFAVLRHLPRVIYRRLPL